NRASHGEAEAWPRRWTNPLPPELPRPRWPRRRARFLSVDSDNSEYVEQEPEVECDFVQQQESDVVDPPVYYKVIAEFAEPEQGKSHRFLDHFVPIYCKLFILN
ncbi:hypothetical protein E2562_035804, partial [Oryza meyeriana var. granulata]